MTKNEFISSLRKAVSEYSTYVMTKDGEWVVKGFIDVYKNIYSISADTKVVSKISNSTSSPSKSICKR